jgi:hypothetical protein
MKTRHRSRRAAATLPAWQWTGATCRGRPRRRLHAPLKCHHRGDRRRPRLTRRCTRARDRQLALPERTSGRSALTWRPTRRVPPSCREPHHTKLTPRGGRRSVRRPSASFSMVLTAPTQIPCSGAGRGGSRRTRRRHRARRRWWILAPPHGACSRGRAPDVHVSLVAGRGQGPTPVVAEAGGSAPERTRERIAAVDAADRSEAAPESRGSKREVPEQGSSSCPAKMSRVRSKM